MSLGYREFRRPSESQWWIGEGFDRSDEEVARWRGTHVLAKFKESVVEQRH